ncbi:MAG TPA: serine hydroxymethyltransferase, partial [Lacipirellulaceae bacterium]|nr:serine hydroxymethyltransferase [Lacipirellulaceae bacterium]
GRGGSAAERALDACGVPVSRIRLPSDQFKPMDPSGIRIGAPALTARGMGTAEMQTIGRWMLEALRSADDAAVHAGIRQQVRDLCADHPAPAAAMEAADVN